MRKRSGFSIRWIAVVVGILLSHSLLAQRTNTAASSLDKLFKDPPPEASPWVFWYWMQASVSREGITADLQAMKEAGIGGAYLMPIKGPANPPYMDSVIVQLTPQWWELIKHAVKEAKQLGIKLGFHVSDGFALAGGPWITPELSMQKVVWSQVQVQGGENFTVQLPQPETLENYYKDIAFLAFPSLIQAGVSSNIVKPVITSSKPDSAVQLLATRGNTRNFNCDDQCWVQYEFADSFTCRAIVIRSRNNYQSNRLTIQVSDDGKNFKTVTQLVPPRHGWQDWDEDYTHAIPPTTAKYFRFSYDKSGSEPGAEDLDAAKWRPSLKITGIELLSEPRIHQYEGKNGSVWRIAKPTTIQELADSLCIPANKIMVLTGNPDGRVSGKLPAGNWTILRIGHTSTGHKNETAGGGKGLESDKFNPAAVTLQFNKWFGEIIKQTGPTLAKDVIEFLHVDSWECGSQNWGANFANEFKKRRGYDLIPYLLVMAGVPVESAERSEQLLRDIRSTIAELINDKFYVTLRDLAHKQGVQLSAESVAPTMMSDGMLHYKTSDIPMGEFWLRSPTHDKPNDMMDAISGAHIYGKRIVQAEGFTQLRMAWDEHPGILKSLGDRNFALGINRLFFHVFVHNPWMDRKPGMTLDAIGLYFQRDQTWWKQAKGWVEYVKRCQALLQAGKPVVDIAVFTGEELPRRSVLPDRLVPALPGIFGDSVLQREYKRLKNEGQPLRTLPQGVTHTANMADPEDWVDPLHGYAYDSYNKDALLSLSSVRNKKISLSTGAEYKILVVPGNTERLYNVEISREVKNKISDFAAKGATILVSRGAAMDTLKGPFFRGPFKDSTFASLGIEPDFIARDENGKRMQQIAWTHRAESDFDIYFISNQLDTARRFDLSLRVSGKVPEFFDPLTGNITEAGTWRIEKNRTIMPIYLEANGSLFVVLRKKATTTSSDTTRNWIASKTLLTITSPWNVTFNPAYGGPRASIRTSQLFDWSKSADTLIRFYSGTALYETAFEWSAPVNQNPVWLYTGTLYNIAEVYVNGISCGVVWTAPFRVDVSKALKSGSNHIRIEVSNTWANRMIGDRRLAPERRITNTIAPYRLEGKPLLPAGLIGPVSIKVD